MLMGMIPNCAGYVSGPLANVKQSFFCSENSQIFFMEYDHLVKNPRGMLRKIYDFLGEKYFEHDFSNVEDSYDEFDDQARISGLHTVRKEVRWIDRKSVIPADLWESVERETVWKFDGGNIKRQLRWSTQDEHSNTPSTALIGRQFRQL
jgi:sulfotransferase